MVVNHFLKAPESSPALDGRQHLPAQDRILDCHAKTAHDLVIMDVKLARQSDPVSRPVDLGRKSDLLTLPIGQVVETLSGFRLSEIVLGQVGCLAGFPIQERA